METIEAAQRITIVPLPEGAHDAHINNGNAECGLGPALLYWCEAYRNGVRDEKFDACGGEDLPPGTHTLHSTWPEMTEAQAAELGHTRESFRSFLESEGYDTNQNLAILITQQ